MDTRVETQREFLYGDLTYKLNGILFSVHNELGLYAREKQYGDLLEKRFKEQNIKYAREVNVADTGNRMDFLIDDKIIIELKSKPFLTKEDYYQIQRYLQCLNMRLGILVNFRTKFLQPKRVLHPLKNR